MDVCVCGREKNKREKNKRERESMWRAAVSYHSTLALGLLALPLTPGALHPSAALWGASPPLPVLIPFLIHHSWLSRPIKARVMKNIVIQQYVWKMSSNLTTQFCLVRKSFRWSWLEHDEITAGAVTVSWHFMHIPKVVQSSAVLQH